MTKSRERGVDFFITSISQTLSLIFVASDASSKPSPKHQQQQQQQHSSLAALGIITNQVSPSITISLNNQGVVDHRPNLWCTNNTTIISNNKKVNNNKNVNNNKKGKQQQISK